MNEWKIYKLIDFVEINPTESLKKGTLAKKIGMDLLQPYTRAIPSYTTEFYSGGTKFRNGDTIMTLSKILCKWQGLIKNGNTPVKKYSKLINC